ncbi:Odorant receptor [Sergentomyia squamirostris]
MDVKIGENPPGRELPLSLWPSFHLGTISSSQEARVPHIGAGKSDMSIYTIASTEKATHSWEGLHVKRDDNNYVQKIIDAELMKTIKFGNIFFRAYNLLFFSALVALTITYNLHNMIVIDIPNIKAEDYEIFYQIMQAGSPFIAAVWNGLADFAIIFIGLCMLSFIKIINKMITSLTVEEIMIDCPDLLLRTMKKHVELIQVLGVFNDGLKLMSFIQIIMSVIMYLVMMFAMQLRNSEYSLYLMFFCVLVQLFLLCFFGEMIKSETEVIFWNLYLTNWYEMNLTDQKIILLMMMNSRNEIGLKAAGIYDVSLMAFVQILKMSLSYSAVILTFTK